MRVFCTSLARLIQYFRRFQDMMWRFCKLGTLAAFNVFGTCLGVHATAPQLGGVFVAAWKYSQEASDLAGGLGEIRLHFASVPFQQQIEEAVMHCCPSPIPHCLAFSDSDTDPQEDDVLTRQVGHLIHRNLHIR